MWWPPVGPKPPVMFISWAWWFPGCAWGPFPLFLVCSLYPLWPAEPSVMDLDGSFLVPLETPALPAVDPCVLEPYAIRALSCVSYCYPPWEIVCS